MDDKALFAISCGLYVIGARCEEKFSGCIVALFGFQSTRQIQKWPHVPHVFQRALPVLQSVAARFVCKVLFTHELATHSLFHCEVLEAEAGEGTPLTYGHYRAHMRHATAAAFQAFKKNLAARAGEQSKGAGSK